MYIDSDRMSVTANDGDDEDDDNETRFLTRGANGKARIIWHSDTSPEKRLTKARTWLISLYGCSIVMYYLCIYTGYLRIGTVETEITWKNKIGIQIFARSIILSKKMILKIGDLITLALF